MKIKLISMLLACSLICTICIYFQVVIVGENITNNNVTIDIVHTNDIHGESSYNADKFSGYEKLATIIKDSKADIVVDAGDTFDGQAFATFEKGAIISELMKNIDDDAIIATKLQMI